jgi:hypothetical protein
MRLRDSIRRLHRLAGSCPAEAGGMMCMCTHHSQECRVGLTETTVTTHSIEAEKLRIRVLTSNGHKHRAGLQATMVITPSMVAEPVRRTRIRKVARVV